MDTASMEELKDANLEFYRAFESLELNEMEPLWDRGPHVKCIHPGWEALHGWEAVRESWRAIFSNTSSMEFHLTDASVHVFGETGWVVCTENIVSEQEDARVTGRVIATNIFVKKRGRWLMVLHHGSPAPPVSAPMERELH